MHFVLNSYVFFFLLFVIGQRFLSYPFAAGGPKPYSYGLTYHTLELCSPGATQCSPGATLQENDLKRSRIISHIFILVSLIVWIISRSFLRFLIFFRFCITPNPSIEDLKFPDFLKKSKKKNIKIIQNSIFQPGSYKKKIQKNFFFRKKKFFFFVSKSFLNHFKTILSVKKNFDIFSSCLRGWK